MFTTISFYPDSEAVFPAAINGSGRSRAITLLRAMRDTTAFSITPIRLIPWIENPLIYGGNDSGLEVANCSVPDNIVHSFVLQSPRIFISYDYPEVAKTFLTGINSSRLISGYYYDGGVYSGFIARLVH